MGVLDWELSTLGHPIADFNYHCISWRNIPDLADEKFCKENGILHSLVFLRVAPFACFETFFMSEKRTRLRGSPPFPHVNLDVVPGEICKIHLGSRDRPFQKCPCFP